MIHVQGGWTVVNGRCWEIRISEGNKKFIVKKDNNGFQATMNVVSNFKGFDKFFFDLGEYCDIQMMHNTLVHGDT